MPVTRNPRKTILGIDVGSVTLSVVKLDLEGNILEQFYIFHNGNINEAILSLKKQIDPGEIQGIACTNGNGLNTEVIQLFELRFKRITK